MHGTIWLSEGRAASAEIGTGGGGDTKVRWRSLVEDLCFDALRSPRGSFEFHPEDVISVPAGPRVRLETIVAAGRRRLEMWHEVEPVIHSFEAVPRLAESLTDGSVTLGQNHWRVLVAVDGRRNVAALARRLDIDLLEFCQLLKPLVEGGAVILTQPDGWLKSLPKVKLDKEPDLPVASIPLPVPETDGAPGLSVVSTPIEPPVQPSQKAAAAAESRSGRRLRSRSRHKSAEAAGNA